MDFLSVQSATVVLAVLYITNLAIRNHTYVPSSHAAPDWLTQLWPVWTRGYRLQKTFYWHRLIFHAASTWTARL